MGRKMRGVEARGTSIRIGFMWMGNYCREPLKLPSTPANMRYADRLRAEILRKIELGTFIYADYFPDSPHATMLAGQRVVYLGRYVEDWLDKKRHMVKASTYDEPPCSHPAEHRHPYHDSSILCTACNEVVEQFGRPIPPNNQAGSE